MKINLSKYGEFIPSWEGNLELPENEQIKVHYKRVTGEMSSGLLRVGQDDTAFFDNVKIVQKCVRTIENLEDADGNKITSAAKLLSATGTHGLVTEIGIHILTDSKLPEEIQKKNKDSSPLVQ